MVRQIAAPPTTTRFRCRHLSGLIRRRRGNIMGNYRVANHRPMPSTSTAPPRRFWMTSTARSRKREPELVDSKKILDAIKRKIAIANSKKILVALSSELNNELNEDFLDSKEGEEGLDGNEGLGADEGVHGNEDVVNRNEDVVRRHCRVIEMLTTLVPIVNRVSVRVASVQFGTCHATLSAKI